MIRWGNNKLKIGSYNDTFSFEGEEYVLRYTLSKKQEPLFRNYEWLHEEYIVKGRAMQDIADQFGVSAMAICHWLKKHSIMTRPPGRFASLISDDD